MSMRIALTALLLFAGAGEAHAQGDWPEFFGDAERSPGTRIQVWNPVAMEFEVITIEKLLEGLLRFPDSHRRYVAVRGRMAGEMTAPAFNEADFQSGTSVVGWETGVGLPAFTGSEESAWLAFAVPVAAGEAQFVNVQNGNDADNAIQLFTRQTPDVTINTVPCVVYASNSAWFTEGLAFFQAYFDINARRP